MSAIDLNIDTAAQAAGDMQLYSFSGVTYDQANNATGYTDSVTGTWSNLGYDSLNRLALASQTPVNGQPQYFCWQYDSFGNRQQQQISSAAFTSGGGASACVAQSSASLATFWNSYLNASNQDPGTNRILSSNASGVAVNLAYDTAGNVTDDGNNAYLYDGEGRICAVRHEAVAGFATMTQYIYDAGGTRVAKGAITNWSAGCDTTQNGFTPQTVYVLGPSGEQMTEMSEVSGAWQWQHTNVVAGSLSATYTNDNVASAAGSVYFHLSDWLGTRRQQTDYAGNPVETFFSLPYGDQFDSEVAANAPAGITDATEHHFTGKERDTESGNDYFGARYYASSMGRFMSPDWAPNVQAVPYADFTHPQTLNLYQYMRNNPLGGADADGHCPGCDWVISFVSTKAATYLAQHPEVTQALSKVAGSLSLKVNAGMGLEESIGKSGFKGSVAASATGFWQFSSKGVSAGSDLKLGASIETPLTGLQKVGGTSETISKENGIDLSGEGETKTSGETGIGNFTNSSDGTLSFGDETGAGPDLGGEIDVEKGEFMEGMRDLKDAIGKSLLDTVKPPPPPPPSPPPPTPPAH